MIDKAEDDAEIKALCLNRKSYNLSEYQDAILGYISGYLVRKLNDRITCSYCAEVLTQQKSSKDDHNYSTKNVYHTWHYIKSKIEAAQLPHQQVL